MFEEVTEKTTTRLKWLVAIQLDWHTYCESLHLITVRIKGIHCILKRNYTNLKMHTNGKHLGNMLIFIKQSLEVNNFKTLRKLIQSRIDEFRSMDNNRRLLISIVGELLGDLFSSLSVGALSLIWLNLKRLATSHITNYST